MAETLLAARKVVTGDGIAATEKLPPAAPIAYVVEDCGHMAEETPLVLVIEPLAPPWA